MRLILRQVPSFVNSGHQSAVWQQLAAELLDMAAGLLRYSAQDQAN
jgi:hypothetical protein